MQTFVMMVGELNYQNNFLEPYLNDDLPFGFLTYYIFVSFVLLMPILLVNLLVSTCLFYNLSPVYIVSQLVHAFCSLLLNDFAATNCP